MTSGPLAVIFMGNLLTVASKRDFPLTRPPKFAFQHIKEPDSFRATLAQVSGSMYSALLGAHTAMDRIQLNVQQVPDQVKTALKLVLAGSPTLIKMMLPKTLESISQIANASAVHARLTFNKFSSLQELIAEIIEASTYTHSNHTNIVNEFKSEINETKLREEELNKNIATITAHYEDARREMEKAQREYQAARNAVPTARRRVKRFFGGLVRALVSIITAPLRIIGCILGLCHTNRAAYETAKRNAIEKANLLLEVLQEAEKRYAIFSEQQAVEQQKLMEVIQQIAALDLERMSEQEIVDILIDSLRQMSKIKLQWARLVQFFSKLSMQADSTQQVSNKRRREISLIVEYLLHLDCCA
jgi:DNA segregation ATPase FtsK/SpoIIIE-like protein